MHDAHKLLTLPSSSNSLFIMLTKQGIRNLNGPKLDGKNHNGRKSDREVFSLPAESKKSAHDRCSRSWCPICGNE